MSDEVASITISEWETQGPPDCSTLAGRFFDASHATRRVVGLLHRSRMLGLSELRQGLQVTAFSHVGRVQVGSLTVTILPKLKGMPLLNLIRYAYGFRRLNLISDSSHAIEHCGFEDLLIHQLNAEVQELVARGLLRSYVSTFERLGSPRGRINLNRLALDGGTATATLPCQHHPRIEDTLLNQVLMAGLRLAASMASVVELRRDSRRLASLMDEQVSVVRLLPVVLNRAARQMNRLTAAYASALSIIRLMVEAQGVVLEGANSLTSLPGFLFDMNAFFQALISRFLRDNLPGFLVRDELGLKGMMQYNPLFHRPKWKSPTPRPDYVVTGQGKICAILDAKYRDLWEKPLPPAMLYQLVVYAISHRQRPQSSILYPTMNTGAKEVRIDVTDPLFGKQLGQVCLRPVLLPTIETLIGERTSQAGRERKQYANQLAFGESV
jgi:5-methylcytosine-specific restriction enzyme subunit McrC